MPKPVDEAVLELQGRVDALTHLCAALAATASPAAANVVITQAEKAVEAARLSGAATPYVAGYAATARGILAAVKLAAEAEKIRSASGPAH